MRSPALVFAVRRNLHYRARSPTKGVNRSLWEWRRAPTRRRRDWAIMSRGGVVGRGGCQVTGRIRVRRYDSLGCRQRVRVDYREHGRAKSNHQHGRNSDGNKPTARSPGQNLTHRAIHFHKRVLPPIPIGRILRYESRSYKTSHRKRDLAPWAPALCDCRPLCVARSQAGGYPARCPTSDPALLEGRLSPSGVSQPLRSLSP